MVHESNRPLAISRSKHPERIILAGFQNDLAPCLAATDIVCLTSQIEAQSKIIPQAFAMRKLVVASNVGGIPELVHKTKSMVRCIKRAIPARLATSH